MLNVMTDYFVAHFIIYKDSAESLNLNIVLLYYFRLVVRGNNRIRCTCRRDVNAAAGRFYTYYIGRLVHPRNHKKPANGAKAGLHPVVDSEFGNRVGSATY